MSSHSLRQKTKKKFKFHFHFKVRWSFHSSDRRSELVCCCVTELRPITFSVDVWCRLLRFFFGVLLPVFCVWLIRISDMISIPLRKNLNYRQREKEEMCKLSIKLSGAIGCDTPTLQTSLRASQKLDKRERETWTFPSLQERERECA